jgi:hypothetical protein
VAKKKRNASSEEKNEKKKKETYALISDGESRDKQRITAAFKRRTTISQAQPHMKVVAATFVFSTHQKQQKPIKKTSHPNIKLSLLLFFFLSPCAFTFLRFNHVANDFLRILLHKHFSPISLVFFYLFCPCAMMKTVHLVSILG